MKIGEQIIVGKMGQQPMTIADLSVDPQHAILRRTGESLYQIEDNHSTKGVFVFGMRVKRKTVKADTPILLGSFKTSVAQLLQDASEVDLAAIWSGYEQEKRLWDRRAMLVNYLRVLPSILTMALSLILGQSLSGGAKAGLTLGLTAVVLVISMIASEKIMARRTVRMSELNKEMEGKYLCPHCHKFLGLTPYQVLKQKRYCPNPACGCPLP